MKEGGPVPPTVHKKTLGLTAPTDRIPPGMKEKVRRLLSFETILGIPNPVLPLVRLATCVHDIKRRVERLQVALGRIESRLDAHEQDVNLYDHEFQVFSQWGEDGVIQYLLRRVAVPNRTFVEFGVEDYQEANTRFLVEKGNWSGVGSHVVS